MLNSMLVESHGSCHVNLVTVLLNQPPTANAGPDQEITLPSNAQLNGTATDDGLPRGSTLEIPLTELKRATRSTNPTNGATTLEAVERDHILRVLSETSWVIGGPGGAAARLGMNRTTLNHRMRKLGISRPQAQRS